MIEHSENSKEKIARLRHTELFGELSPGAIRSIAEAADFVRFNPGEIIVQEGESGDSLYILTNGLLRVSRITPAGKAILGEIHKGGFFGEFALLESIARNATIEAVSPSLLLQISRKNLEQQFVSHPEIKTGLLSVLERRKIDGGAPIPPLAEEKRNVLSGLFDGLSPEASDTLNEEFEWMWLPTGETLIKEGTTGDAFYVVLDGQLRVTTNGEEDELFIGLIGPGETVGEMSLISNIPHTATVKATSSTQLLRIHCDEFHQLMRKHSALMAPFRLLIQNRLNQRSRLEELNVHQNGHHTLTLQNCEDVVRTTDLILRNYKITEGYHRLALDLADVLGSENANWPAFGTHASKSAGFTIRKEDFGKHSLDRPSSFQRFIKTVGWTLTPTRFIKKMDRLLEWVSESISDGNLRIFGEMAPVMVRFVELMRTDGAKSKATIIEFCETLKPGASETGGQDLLADALLAWYEASQESNPKRKSELMLLGNARMGLHEQIRIQPDLDQALGAPLRNRLEDDFSHTVDKRLQRLPIIFRRAIRKGLQFAEKSTLHFSAKILRRIITNRMMRLRLPDLDIWLRDDVPLASADSIYPRPLETLTEPALVELFNIFTKNPDRPDNSGAVDWSVLDDRMNFILHLFRAQQQNPSLYTSPVTDNK